MSECKSYRSEIEELAHGQTLSGNARAHVESCGACGEFLRAGESLRQIVRGLERVEAPADFEFRLRARIAKRKGGRGRFQQAWLGPFTGYATVAVAVGFVVISASLYFWQRREPVDVRKESVAAQIKQTSAQPPRNIVSGPTPASSPAVVSVTVPTMMKQSNAVKLRGGTQQHFRETVRVEVAPRTPANNSAPIMISVNRSAEPLRVVLRDEQGTAHVVQMRAVSFGSQELLSREVAGGRASAKNDEGVW